MNREESEAATSNYLRKQKRQRLVAFCIVALFAASIVIAHQPDDWNRFNHRSFSVTNVSSDGLVRLSTGDQIKLLGISNIDPTWLRNQILNQSVTLLLQLPQTRDSQNHLLAFVYQDNVNLSTEGLKQGMARMDRHDKTLFDGLLAPAEADARKKKRGVWGPTKISP